MNHETLVTIRHRHVEDWESTKPGPNSLAWTQAMEDRALLIKYVAELQLALEQCIEGQLRLADRFEGKA